MDSVGVTFVKRLLLIFPVLFSLVIIFLSPAAFCLTGQSLLKTTIDPGQISVSGISSGAYMAVQLHVAYSNIFMGLGAVAGGPYYCAEDRGPGHAQAIKRSCLTGLGIDTTAKTYINEAIRVAQHGKIAALNHLANDKVFLFNGQYDQVISPKLGGVSELFYRRFINDPASQLVLWHYIPAFGPGYPVAHGMPTANKIFERYQNPDDQLTPCAPSNTYPVLWPLNTRSRGRSPWIYYCHHSVLPAYSLVEDIFEHIYGPLQKSVKPDMSRMFWFNQRDYIDDPAVQTNERLTQLGLGEKAYLYVPAGCIDGIKACRLHVALHGCLMYPEWTFKGKEGSQFEGQEVKFGGLFREHVYNDVAESNDIIVLYPQARNIGVKQRAKNPYGCWEFWPFDERHIMTYHTRDAPGMKLIINMINALVDRTMHVHMLTN